MPGAPRAASTTSRSAWRPWGTGSSRPSRLTSASAVTTRPSSRTGSRRRGEVGMRDSKNLLGHVLSEGPPGLEGFVRRYADAAGGTWEEVEPQVYDLLLPHAPPGRGAGADTVVRIAFDPEALPENPGAQLASLGTPLVNVMTREARRRGRLARLHAVGLNESPRDLASHLHRAVKVPEGCELRLELGTTLDFPQSVFWFQASFSADQKEEEII